tara:strand:- start:1729 stop:2727 length:999 start_codon:yes stop_codon:yes gene_type:complete
MKISYDIDFTKWKKFSENHPNFSIFQSVNIYKAYKKTKYYDPITISVLHNNEIVGCVLAVIKFEPYGKFTHLTKRSIIIGGPLVKDDNIQILEFLLKNYNIYINKKAIYTQIRNLNYLNNFNEIFLKYGFKYEDHLNIHVDLTKDYDSLYSDLNVKRRNEIKRAKREGVKFEIRSDYESLLKSYNILSEVYERAKLPLADFSLFNEIKIQSDKNIGLKVGIATFENKIIGCMIFLFYKNTIYDYYAGSYSKYYNKFPNQLIPWEIFNWAKQEGFKIFDFGGAGKPGIPYGVRDYKKKFGGSLINLGRYIRVHRKLLYITIKYIYGLWKRIKK